MSTVITKNTSDLVQLLEKANSLPDIGGDVTINNQNKTITENGVYTADNGYTGLGVVTVNVPIPEQYGLITYDQDKTITIT